ncbi:MAG: RIP metalloprotease RseP [Legionella sp.]|nr:RIP metalloprotease RseP [Legionella sp.]
MLLTMVYFLLALLLLVIVHEYGHFQVARWCGVKVLRFSFGFGKVLAQIQDKKGTQYVWSLVPLGGYVKMLGESASPVAEDEKHMAFNNKSIWVRTAIVLAGPLFNFLFALVALWLVLVIGMYSLAPIVKSVHPNSIAAKAGMLPNQKVIGLNDRVISSWKGFQYAMMPFIGSDAHIRLTLESLEDGKHRQVILPLKDWKLSDKDPNPLKELGIVPFVPVLPPLIGGVVKDSPAAHSSLQANDKIVTVDGQPVSDWLFFVNYIKTHPDALVHIAFTRAGNTHDLMLKTGHQRNHGKVEGFVGLQSQKPDWPKQWLHLEKEGPLQALKTALKQTWDLSGATFILMGRLLTGKVSLKSISGPVGIAQGAGYSGRNGFVAYLFFLALVSISLGTINLLPIPMLDGGHLLYYAIETVLGRPVSEGIKNMGLYVGVFLLSALMFVALTNDISRLID